MGEKYHSKPHFMDNIIGSKLEKMKEEVIQGENNIW